MSKDQIKQFIQERTAHDGLTESGIPGVRLFRATEPVPCIPAVYEPCVVAIVSGEKEAVHDGHRYLYDRNRYLFCPMSMPVQAGTPNASTQNPLYGVFVSLEPRLMSEITLAMEYDKDASLASDNRPDAQGIQLAQWDETFTEALLRLLLITENSTDIAVLGAARLNELFYAILKGEAGAYAKEFFKPDNAIAHSIKYVARNLDSPISIEQMASHANMSRAAFHRKFKQVTTMAPIQFVKSMRLNSAAMMIASGVQINKAAMQVGYASTSQFSREFKRLYGQSPRAWSEEQPMSKWHATNKKLSSD